ncbi:MAG: prepilin-type N-terminal cleavage/methylation domain-containing protein [Phycisphaeraceae bacterium]|nr:prepilin-type N-terminal cleavage/methylation domain-containing protein [Phycisphaeraceae bacterium]
MRRAFTLIELLVVISIIALLIAILLPALGAARQSARKIQSNTQMRGMQQGMVIYAQSNGGFYPGLTAKGKEWVLAADNYSALTGASVPGRFAIMLEEDLFTPDYAIHPAEPEQRTVYDVNGGSNLDNSHYSYAMLELVRTNNGNGQFVAPANSTHKVAEWRETMNSQAIVLGDRLLDVVGSAFGDPSAYVSVWNSDPGRAEWGVVWNDNHTESELTPFFETKYGTIANSNDDIYSRQATISGNVQTPSGKTTGNAAGNAMLVSDLYTNLY